MLWEKILVTAKEFLSEKDINTCKEINEPIYQSKLKEIDWDMPFSAASTFCEIVWKISIGPDNLREWRELDRLFSPSPIATHCNFRGGRSYRTGNTPEKGALAVWRRGNSWQGHIAIVSNVSENKMSFDTIEGRLFTGNSASFIQVQEKKDKSMALPFKTDKLNLVGFIYPKDREI